MDKTKQTVKQKIKTVIGTQQLSFLKHSKNYFIGSIGIKALSLISAPVFTRILMPNDYGILAMFNSIAQILVIIFVLNFHGALARKYHEKDDDFSSFLGSIQIFIIILNILSVTVLIVFRQSISQLLNISADIFVMSTIYAFIQIFSLLYYVYLKAALQSKKYSVLAFISSLSNLILSIIVVLIMKDSKYLGKIYVVLFVSSGISIYSLYNLVKISKFAFQIKHIKYAAKFGIPLIPHAMSGFILAQFDRLIINQYCGSADTGLYTAAYSIGMLMSLCTVSINTAFVPIFYKKLNNNEHSEIKKIVSNNSKLIFLCALGLIFFSYEAGSILIGKNFHSSLHLVPIIVIGYVFEYFYQVYGTYAFYEKRTLLFSGCTVIAGILNIVLNYIFIPKYGYVAAAYTTVISYMAMVIIHYLSAKYILKQNIPSIKTFYKQTAIFVVCIVLYYTLLQSNINVYITFIIKLAAILSFAYYVIKTYKKV